MVRYHGSRAEAFIERDNAVVCASCTHIHSLSEGRGTEVWDVDSGCYLDLSNDVVVTSTGHSHPEIVRAIQSQTERLQQVSGMDFCCPSPARLTQQPSRIALMDVPACVFFTGFGAEAIGAALNLARYAAEREHLAVCCSARYGRTLGAPAFAAKRAVQRRCFFPTSPPVIRIRHPDSYRPFLPDRATNGRGDDVIFLGSCPREQHLPRRSHGDADRAYAVGGQRRAASLCAAPSLRRIVVFY